MSDKLKTLVLYKAQMFCRLLGLELDLCELSIYKKLKKEERWGLQNQCIIFISRNSEWYQTNLVVTLSDVRQQFKQNVLIYISHLFLRLNQYHFGSSFGRVYFLRNQRNKHLIYKGREWWHMEERDTLTHTIYIPTFLAGKCVVCLSVSNECSSSMVQFWHHRIVL